MTFERNGGYWVPDRQSVGFTGITQFDPIEFLITTEALVAMLNPELDHIDGKLALETLIQFEVDILRLAQLEFIKRFCGEPPH